MKRSTYPDTKRGAMSMPELTDQLVITLQTHKNPVHRVNAAEQLSTDPSIHSIRALIAALNDNNESVCLTAAESLATIGGGDAARMVAQLLERESMRLMACEVLSRFGHCAISPLEPFLHHSNHEVRNSAIEILGRIKHRDAATAIIPLLYHDDPDMVVAVVEALGNQEQEVSISHLEQVYEKEEYARPAIAEALGKIGGREASRVLFSSFRSGMLTGSTDPMILFRIIEAFVRVGNPDAVALLSHHLSDAHGNLRQTILAAIIWLCDKSGLPLDIPGATIHDLIAVLNDTDVRVRLNAVQKLSHVDDPDVTRAFLGILGGSTYLDAVLFGLLEGRKDALPVMLEMLRNGHAPLQREMFVLLKTLLFHHISTSTLPVSQPDANILFGKAAEQWLCIDDESKQLILETLFLIDRQRTFCFLTELLAVPDPWVRIKTIEVLGRFADRDVLELVSQQASDEDETVRSTVEWILEASARST
ncbi:MAG: HEAT repeat domain-containing protein [Bacteroidetes bacterium]|nr:HEAT repeat domain-containing protein [Bacteroidota bacterium]MCW5895124.1 HEAT repeat domain-containing protein [Bacteroidota bacterium]